MQNEDKALRSASNTYNRLLKERQAREQQESINRFNVENSKIETKTTEKD